MMRWLALVICWVACEVAWAQGPKPVQTNIRLTDVSNQCGINFVHSDGGVGQRTVVESVVAGMATFDYDNDGLVDIYFLSSRPIDGRPSDISPALYRNLGNWTFQDVTEQAGLKRAIYGMGAVAADIDEDGDVDLYVSAFGTNILYQNGGDGTFEDVTSDIGLKLPEKVGAGCAFLDIENDGDLDLFVGSYVQFSLDKHIPKMIGKHAFHPGPTDYPPSNDALFRNNGDGTFTDISHQSGIRGDASYSMGVVAFDADGDGDSDILVANDQRPNSLWINDGHGVFQDQATLAGVAVDRLGKANGNMAVELGDLNGDGLLDIFTTTYQDEMPVLYMSLGNGQYLDQTNTAQIDPKLKPHVKWGCGLVDLDNDGDLDMYVACGHFHDNIRAIDDRTDVKVRDFVLENRGGKFVNVTAAIGTAANIVESSRAVALEDLDNDGDIDIVVLNANARPSILRNDCPVSQHGKCFELVGTRGSRSAIGATVRLNVGDRQLVQTVVAGRGYQSHYGSRLHFATDWTGANSLEVKWSSGSKQLFESSDFETGTSMIIEKRN